MNDPERQETDGWERRSIAQEPRLSEIVELYGELGFEVRIEDLAPDDPACRDTGCKVCFEDPEVVGQMKVVYTRR